MPVLDDVTYSRDVCVDAIRDYYYFLTKMYLRDSTIIEPPAGGWPTITTTSMQAVGKTETVISLLRHLPYIRDTNYEDYLSEGAAFTPFVDWKSLSEQLLSGSVSGEECRIVSEKEPLYEQVPAHVVGLTTGPPSDHWIFLLDTELGVIYWLDCPYEIQDDPCVPREMIWNPDENAPENEIDWRAGGACWAVADFFEVLKDQFRRLHFLPMNEFKVKDIYTTYNEQEGRMVAMAQKIYRQHGWPHLRRYRKHECLEAVQKAVEEHYP